MGESICSCYFAQKADDFSAYLISSGDMWLKILYKGARVARFGIG